MIAKTSAIVLAALFVWALIYTNDDGEAGNAASAVQTRRPGKPSPRAASRDTSSPPRIEVVDELPQGRQVTHALGTTVVPLVPRRIVSLSSAATESLLALGVQPILVETPSGVLGKPVHLADRLKDVPTIRGGDVLSLEAVSEVKPDLIFIGAAQNGRLYPQFSKIAPTVPLGAAAQGNWELRILDVGNVLGMADEAETRLNEYHQFVKAAKKKLSAASPGRMVVFLRFRKDTCVIYTQSGMFGPLLFRQLGLEPDPAMPISGGSKGWDVLSLERLSTLRAEHIFMVVDKDSEQYLKTVAASPIWRQIPAVQHGHVHRVASGTWLGSEGLLASEAIVRDVLAAMTTEGGG